MGRDEVKWSHRCPICMTTHIYYRVYPLIFKRFQALCQTAACGWKEVVEQFMLSCILKEKLPEEKLKQIIMDLEKKASNNQDDNQDDFQGSSR